MPSPVFALTEPACKTTSPIWQTSLVQLIRINATWMTTSRRTWLSRTNSTVQSFQNKIITAQDRKHRRLFVAKHSSTELQTVSKTDNTTKITILAVQYNLCLLFTDKSQDKNYVLGQIDYRDWQKRKKLHWRLQQMQMGTLVSLNGGFLPYKSKATNTILNNELNLEQIHKRSSHKCLQHSHSELSYCFPVGFLPSP